MFCLITLHFLEHLFEIQSKLIEMKSMFLKSVPVLVPFYQVPLLSACHIWVNVNIIEDLISLDNILLV